MSAARSTSGVAYEAVDLEESVEAIGAAAGGTMGGASSLAQLDQSGEPGDARGGALSGNDEGMADAAPTRRKLTFREAGLLAYTGAVIRRRGRLAFLMRRKCTLPALVSARAQGAHALGWRGHGTACRHARCSDHVRVSLGRDSQRRDPGGG